MRNNHRGEKRGLQGKVFKLCLFLVLLSIFVFSIFDIVLLRELLHSSQRTGERQKTAVSETSEASMEKLVRSYFISHAIAESDISDNAFWDMASSIFMLALQVQGIYRNPDNYGSHPVALPDKGDAGTVTAQLLFSDRKAEEDPVIREQVDRLGNLQEQMVAIIESNAGLMDCAISIPGGATILCDAASDRKFDEKGRISYVDATSRPWYKDAVEKGRMTFTSVNEEFFTGEDQVNVSIPVYLDGEIVAVCCGSMTLAQIEGLVENAHVGENGFSCIINEEGHILFSNRKDGTLGLSNREDLRKSDNAALASMVSDAISGEVNAIKLSFDDRDYFITYAPLATVGWTQLMVIPQNELNAPTEALLQQLDILADESQTEFFGTVAKTRMILIIVLIVMVSLAVVLSMVFAKRLVSPIKRMTLRIGEISGDDRVFDMDDEYRTGDEIETLAASFHDMSIQTVEYISEITSITAEKERISTELSTARNIQMGLLPKEMKGQKGFRIQATMTAAKEVGGDFYDYYMIDGDHLCFLVADVCGKGVPAALFMATSKSAIRSRAKMGGTPEQILMDAQDIISENNEGQLFVTVWLGIIELSTGHMKYCSAGHEYPGLKRAGGNFGWVRDEGKKKNVPVAFFPGAPFTGKEMTLAPGDRVFLYTDGLPEAVDDTREQFGMDRALAALNEVAEASDSEVLAHVWDRVNEFIGDTPQFDDTTMLSFTYLGPDDPGRTDEKMDGADFSMQGIYDKLK